MNTPGVINLTQEEGSDAAARQGMTFYVMGAYESTTAARGIIMSQDPAPGTKVPAGSRLKVEVSTGPQYALIPDIIDTLWVDSEAKITSAGFIPKIFYENNNLVPEGAVISLGHPAGENFQIGEKLKVVVSQGPDGELTKTPVNMPNIAGRDYAEAKGLLNKNGLRVIRENDQYSMTVPKGEVIAQSTSAGKRLMTGDIVYVSISMGVEQTNVPNVQYLERQNAISALQSAKLNYTVKEEESDTVREGLVIQQSVEAGSIVDVKTNVIITVSLGKLADMPSLVGTTLNKARSEMAALGFENVTYTGKYDAYTAENVIMTQSVPAGRRINVEEHIEIVYSMGKMPVNITLDANGGSVSTTSFTAHYPDTYGTLPTPTRDYYTFRGWYSTVLGSAVTANSTVPETEYETLSAMWEENPLSGWVQADNMPQDGQVVNRKYSYSLTEYTTSQNKSMSGWEMYDSKRELSDYGSWSAWSTTPVSATNNRKVDTKTESTQVLTSYNMVEYNTMGGGERQYRSYSVGGNYSGYGVAASYGEFHRTGTYSIDEVNRATQIAPGGRSSGAAAGINKDSRTGYVLYCEGHNVIMFVDSENYSTQSTTYYRYADRTETTIYYFKRTVQKESMSRPSGSDVSNVVEYVQYRNR